MNYKKVFVITLNKFKMVIYKFEIKKTARR